MNKEGFTSGDMADIGAEQFLKGFEAGKKAVPKSIVFFKEALTTPEIGYRCSLLGVTGHPKLGNEPMVHTSYVVDVRDGGDTIETKNTIYKKE